MTKQKKISQKHWDVIESITGKNRLALKEYALDRARPDSVRFRSGTADNTFRVDLVQLQSRKRLIALLETLEVFIDDDWFDLAEPCYPYKEEISAPLVALAASNPYATVKRDMHQELPHFPDRALGKRVVNETQQRDLESTLAGVYSLYRYKGDAGEVEQSDDIVEAEPRINNARTVADYNITRELLVVEKTQSTTVAAYLVTRKLRVYRGYVYKNFNAVHSTLFRDHNQRQFTLRQILINVPAGAKKFSRLSGIQTRIKSSDHFPMTSDFALKRSEVSDTELKRLIEELSGYFEMRGNSQIDEYAPDHDENFRRLIHLPANVPPSADLKSAADCPPWVLHVLRAPVVSYSPAMLAQLDLSRKTGG